MIVSLQYLACAHLFCGIVYMLCVCVCVCIVCVFTCVLCYVCMCVHMCFRHVVHKLAFYAQYMNVCM